MIRWARGRWRNIGIGRKLLMVNLLVVVLPLLMLFLFISRKLIALTSMQFIDACSQTVDQAAGYLSYKLTGVSNISDAAFYDPEKYLMISQDPKTYPLPEQLFDAWRLKNFVNSLTIIDSSVRIHMYVNDELYYANEEVIFHPLSRVIQSDWLNELTARGMRLAWLPGERIDPSGPSTAQGKTLSVVRRVIDRQDYFKTMAVLRVDLPLADIEQMLAKAVVADGSRVWLVNGEGEVLARNDPVSPDVPAPEEMLAYLSSAGWREARRNGQDYLVSAVPVGDTGLTIVAAFPQSVPLHRSDALRVEFLLIVLGVMAAALGMSLWFAGALSSRLGHIMQRMRRVQSGNLQPIEGEPQSDEIGELTKTYNFMVGRIRRLADERYELGREAHRHEMRALQGQINPHFLYNMLDLINLTLLDRGMPDMAELVRMLARFYRLGLNRGRDTVTIADELEHVALFLRMQNRRFGDRIRFEIDADDGVRRMQMLKIVLQPIVENSVVHGILHERDGSGHIWISASAEDGYVFFSVRDDGVGIQRDKLDSLLDREGAGYGLYNVHRRLCIYYGPECGLSVDSKESGGTVVSFRIPIHAEEQI